MVSGHVGDHRGVTHMSVPELGNIGSQNHPLLHTPHLLPASSGLYLVGTPGFQGSAPQLSAPRSLPYIFTENLKFLLFICLKGAGMVNFVYQHNWVTVLG